MFAALHAFLRIDKAAAAGLPQGIERAVTEQTVEVRFFHVLMTGKELTVPILKKAVVMSVVRNYSQKNLRKVLKMKKIIIIKIMIIKKKKMKIMKIKRMKKIIIKRLYHMIHLIIITII